MELSIISKKDTVKLAKDLVWKELAVDHLKPKNGIYILKTKTPRELGKELDRIERLLPKEHLIKVNILSASDKDYMYTEVVIEA